MPKPKMNRLFFIAVFIVLGLFACDPPHFAWPERIPDVELPKLEQTSGFDRWKAARLKQKNVSLIAGAAKVDLTPKRIKGVWMGGYMPNKRATHLDRPIMGRVLLLDDGKETLVLVSVDFVGLMNNRIWRVRNRVSRKYGESIMIASTHTHAGPDTLGLWGPWAFMSTPVASGVDEGYMQRVERDLAKAVIEAAYSAKPAKLYAGKIEIPQGISENAHKPGFKDDMMTVLQAREKDTQATIATLVNYAVHAEFLGGNNTALSPDFPGVLNPALEEKEGGVALFMNGAIGCIIVPAMPRRTENHVRLREKGMIRAGKALASYARKALEHAELLRFQRMNVDRKLLPLPVKNELFHMLREKGILDRVQKNGHLFTEVWRIDLGALRLLTIPGELSPYLGFQYKNTMGGRYQMLIGLANDELGYIMSSKEWEDPLYAYERTVSVGEDTGALLTKTVEALYPK